MKRRGLLAAALLAAPARAQSFPTQPLRLIVPFPPGGPVDAAARLLAAALAPVLGQNVLVENRSGAGGVIGVDAVAKSAPDGYTLAFASTGPASVNVSLLPNLPYHPLRDFAPVSIVAATPSLFVVKPALPVQSVAEFVALAKREPGRLSFGSTGPGGTPHLAPELLQRDAGIQLNHIVYRGAAPAITALLAGEIDCGCHDISVLLPHVRAGVLRPLALCSPARAAVLPQVPSMPEAGYPDVLAETWYPLLAPAGTPPDRVALLSAAVRQALAPPAVAERFTSQGTRIIAATPAEATAFIAAEIAKWGALVRSANIRPD